jgi:transcriptional regulator with PAS, ATPase and Fis domain
LRVAFCVDRPVVSAPLVQVPRQGLEIGRKVGAGLRLDDARISAHHATVRRTESGELFILDNTSKNGTFVNGVRIDRSPLKLGDVVSVGDTCLVVAAEPDEVEEAPPTEGLVGDSAEMRRIRALVRKVGPSSVTVLLIAESGCGKEVVANALHRASGARGEFVPVNCAAVPESLFESQFFGHRAGAFTGAAASSGFFRAAAHGTLFLDEVGELPLSQQPKLLRAIQERAIVPLGETRAVPCPVRIVAATNRDLDRAVEARTFRGDLLARLFETKITLPPLRKRREDILSLFSLPFGGPPVMTHALAEALLLHSWPFNVREALAVAREMLASSVAGESLGVEPFHARLAMSQSSTPISAKREGAKTKARTVPAAPPDAATLAALLQQKAGNVADVARELGRSRRQVYRWIQKYHLCVDGYRE